jgi:GTP pyrophosphokinase
MPHTTEAVSVNELTEVNRSFARLMRSLRPKLKGQDKENIQNAFDMAVDAHKFQRRKSGEPYILHPIEVARICHQEIGLGPTAVICAILHDVVEDTPVELPEIHDMFGSKITSIVDGLTKLDGLYNVGGNQNAENLKKVLSTLVHDVRVILIKMADRLHNLRTIGPMPQHKQLKIAAETMYIYAPLAHRLGLYNVKTEFEDMCMQITDPEQYEEIAIKVRESEEDRKKYIRRFLRPIRSRIKQLEIPVRIMGRSKSISSIYNKIKKKKVDFEEIYDLFAVRIIMNVPVSREKTICWEVYSIITDYYKPIPERLKDWITTPKGNGYESLHTTVIGPEGKFVEVQIRSERMDDIAERGFAAHWKYKGIKSDENVYEKWLDNIRGLLDNQNGDAIDFINDFKTNLFKEEVYVFTPRGDMRILPKGSSVLDFAFDIHTDIGARATSFKVNNKLVPMGYSLRNGDQIQVTTSKNQSPKEDWLKLVITGKARSKIRSSLNEQRKKQADLGKESLQRKLRNLKVDFELNADKVVSHLGFKNRQELYLSIEADKTKLQEFNKFFSVEGNMLAFIGGAPKEKREERKVPPPPKEVRKDPNLILINDEPADTYKYQLSPCCNPVPGDKIFAFLTTNQGLKIHRFNCSNASNLFTNYGYRILKANWASSPDQDFVVEFKVTGVDSGPGVIQMLTHEISNTLGMNIRSFSIEGDGGIFEGSIKILIKNKNQIKQVIHALKNIENISTVERTYI